MLVYLLAVGIFLGIRYQQLQLVELQRDQTEITFSNGRWLGHTTNTRIVDLDKKVVYTRSIKNFGINTHINPFDEERLEPIISFYKLRGILFNENIFFGYNGRHGWKLIYDFLSYYLGDVMWVYLPPAIVGYFMFGRKKSNQDQVPKEVEKMNHLGFLLFFILIFTNIFI